MSTSVYVLRGNREYRLDNEALRTCEGLLSFMAGGDSYVEVESLYEYHGSLNGVDYRRVYVFDARKCFSIAKA